MDSDRLNRWLQLIASFGLLVGIVLVIVQIQQASDLARAQLRSDIEFADQQQELSMLGENPAEAWAKSILAPQTLSPGEVKIIENVRPVRAECMVIPEWSSIGPAPLAGGQTVGIERVRRVQVRMVGVENRDAVRHCSV